MCLPLECTPPAFLSIPRTLIYVDVYILYYNTCYGYVHMYIVNIVAHSVGAMHPTLVLCPTWV